MGERFGFRVTNPDELSSAVDRGYWEVSLPHSCDRWVIGLSRDQGEVVKDLQAFIVEAQATLHELRTKIAERQTPGIRTTDKSGSPSPPRRA